MYSNKLRVCVLQTDFYALKPLFQSAAEAVAAAVQPLLGSGDKYAIDLVAVNTLRDELNKINMRATIVVGEGEADESAFLYNGEKVGAGWQHGAGIQVDIAVDPVDGTTNAANNTPNAVVIMGVSPAGTMRSIPDIKMQKIAVQPKLKSVGFSLEKEWQQTFKDAANALNKPASELKILFYSNSLYENLNRDKTLWPAMKDLDIKPMHVPNEWAQLPDLCAGRLDMIVGIGGAPEGVIATAALIEVGGAITAQLCVDDALLFPDVDTKKFLVTTDIIKSADAFYVQAEITPLLPLKFEAVNF